MWWCVMLVIMGMVRSPCGGCELGDEDLDAMSYCAFDLEPGDGGLRYQRCYTLAHEPPSFNCSQHPYACDHHGRGCGSMGECVCPPNSKGAVCVRYPDYSVFSSATDADSDCDAFVWWPFVFGLVAGCAATLLVVVPIGSCMARSMMRNRGNTCCQPPPSDKGDEDGDTEPPEVGISHVEGDVGVMLQEDYEDYED